MITLANVIETWIKNSKYNAHFSIISSTIASCTLTWIKCTCVQGTSIPPTPKYDIVILEDMIDVWQQGHGNLEIIRPTDPQMFDKLSKLLDNAHETQ